MLDYKNQALLVIAPHPDDEVIGCAGLIKKIKDALGKVYVLYLTVGDTQDFTKSNLSTENERKSEIEKVAKFLKFDNYHLALAGNDYHLKLDLVGQKALMDLIERDSPVAIEKVKPTIIAFPFSTSYNQDHKVVALASHAAVRPAPTKFKHLVSKVISYESPAEFWRLKEQKINFFVPLSKHELSAKTTAMGLYSSQVRQSPNPRSIKVLTALAAIRGSQCGEPYAEGYTIYREII